MDGVRKQPPLIEEFCAALREEIEAAKRSAASGAISLSNGRQIAQIGTNYQYTFSIDSLLNLPDDSPGELVLPGKPPLDTLIVSKEGLSVTISVNTNIGPFIPIARLQTSITFLMKILAERLTAYGDKPNPGGDRILGVSPPRGNPQAIDSTSERINPEQLSAIASSLGRDTTFIWGPPGTGKTEVIGKIGGGLFRSNRTLLVVSHTNTAVDGALGKIARNLAGAFSEGEILRVGNPKKDDIRDHEPELLLSKLAEKQAAEFSDKKDGLQEERGEVLVKVKDFQRTIDL
ncbi:MAG: AAA domain-containing protein, partial [Planctomycetota bacterium]